MTELTESDLEAIAAHLVRDGVTVAGPLRSTRIAGGRSNLTFRIDDGAATWVLRMPPRAGRTPSAHDVGREFRVTRALEETAVPVAKAISLCEDESVIGSPFAIADYVPGTTVQSRTDLDALNRRALDDCIARLVETLAALHAVDYTAVGLESFGRPDGYAPRQLRRWGGQWEIVALDDADVRRMAEQLQIRLGASVPEQRSASIVHGDFRLDNTILNLTGGRARVAAVVDWELSTIGDPVADVAMMCVYRDPAFDLVLGAPSAWTSDRLPSTSALVAAYESAGGIPLVGWDFHTALAYFKVAVIAAGIDHRYRAGATVGEGFDTAAKSVPLFLEAGLRVLKV